MKPFFLFIPSMGIGEWVIILIIVLVFFGGKRVSGVFRGFGEGVREFKEGLKDGDKKSTDDLAKKNDAPSEDNTKQST